MIFHEREEPLPFQDRVQAGRMLASRLGAYSGRADVVVIGLARGGGAVAFEVAWALNAPLDVLVVRKLGTPWREELGMGAIAAEGISVLDLSMIERMGLTQADIQTIVDSELRELKRHEQIYRDTRPVLPVVGRTVIVVDDGIATGNSMLAAIRLLRKRQAARIVVATPVVAGAAVSSIALEAEAFVRIAEPAAMTAVSEWYVNFGKVSDQDVCTLLDQANAAGARVA